ncbi:MAG TPA: tRNA 2-thiouridine(34) synthase MnmA, partial [Phycicoccus elongatus]|nr:tRNA 2-thiouridine(34) synthase MnmA [Phycicoccus elongatus]
KPDSHDICFIPDGDTSGFLAGRLGEQPGELVTTDGEVVGTHAGSFGFTVGQRRGLGIDRSRLDGEPRYVVDVDAPTNRVVIGTAGLLGVRQITGEHARWCGPAPIGTIRAGAQVRAHGEEVGCAAYQGPGGELEVTLDAPIRGVAPGQSVVLYDGTRVIGSATISSTRAHPQSR